MKKIFINSAIISGIVMLSLFIFNKCNEDNISPPDNQSYQELLDSINRQLEINNQFILDRLSKIDSINKEETTIINHYETFEQDILNGNIPDDSIAMFIANQISDRQQELLLL